ncbi:MAG: PLP-dependent cysteine synthase family protein, partial [Candidatus Eiseniibacteriota bacterium]
MRPETGTRVPDPTQLVGRTPMLDLSDLAGRPGVELFGKCEWFNPGGSVKDRPALWMIQDGLARSTLRPGMTILDATSGNTGIGYAWIGAALGYPVELCVPANANEERKQALRAYGARIIETDPLLGTDGAIEEARQRAAVDPKRLFYPDQYSNPANWRAHYESTGPEILEQTDGRVTHLVAGLGTTGTMMGVGRRLAEYNPAIRRIGVQPDRPLHGIEGLKHLATDAVPAIYEPARVDEHRFVSTERAYAMCRRVARERGLWIGVSSGAA